MPLLTVRGFSQNYEQVGEGEPLVYIAGTRFDSAKLWLDHMGTYATGFRVILPDPRGLGGSAHVDSVEPSDWVDDLDALLDQLNIPSAHLAAETLGTRIVTRFAAKYPQRVKTLILNGTIAYSSPTADSARAAPLSDQRKRDLEMHHGADWSEVNAFYLRLHGRPEFHEYFDLRNIAPQVKAPVLLLRGDTDDPVHPIMHSVELHNLMPQSWLAIFPHTEFNALRGRPTEAWKLIRDFIAENAAAG